MRNPRNEPLGAPDIAEAPGTGDGPERRCVLSGRNGAREELVRLALSPEGVVLPDAHAKAPGRGAWIGVSKGELAEAVAGGKLKGALARAFKGACLEIAADLADLATDELIAKKREAPRRRAPAPTDGPPLRRPQRAEDKGGVLGEFGLSEEQGNEIIMAARAHWFDDEEAPAAEAPATEEAAGAESSQ